MVSVEPAARPGRSCVGPASASAHPENGLVFAARAVVATSAVASSSIAQRKRTYKAFMIISGQTAVRLELSVPDRNFRIRHRELPDPYRSAFPFAT